MDLRLGQLELDWHEAAPSSSSGASAVGFLITLFLAKMSSYDIACKRFFTYFEFRSRNLLTPCFSFFPKIYKLFD